MVVARSLLVTGASSGIGLDLATTFGKEGHRVYATARKNIDLDRLATFENVIPLRVDVRDPETIARALAHVEADGAGLYGLVNNAGVGGLGPLHSFPDEDLHDLFDINVFGVHRMTNAFLDLLLASKGRIVTVGSQGGVLSMAYFGPYTMTKHAIEAYTVALDDELRKHGVHASVIQAGGVVSEIGEKSNEGTVRRFRLALRDPFREEAETMLGHFESEEVEEPPQDETDSAAQSQTETESETETENKSTDKRRPSPPSVVTRAVRHALFDPSPRIRYLVGTQREGDRVVHNMLDKLLDANEAPTHGYSRDELVALLDQHITDRAGAERHSSW